MKRHFLKDIVLVLLPTAIFLLYDEDGIPVSIDGIPIAPDAGSKNYEGIGDTSIYDPIESFGVEFPSIP